MHGITATIRRLGASAIVGAALVAVVAASGAVPAAAVEADPTWEVAAPDGPHDSDRSNFRYSVDPGERIEDSVLASNTERTHRLSSSCMRPTRSRRRPASSTSARGAILRPTWARGSGSGSTASVLQSGEQVEVPFVVSVPDDAAGEYVGAIVTSAPGASAEAERRAAIRVLLHVGASFHPSLSIEDVRVDYSGAFTGDGEVAVSYTIRNTGDAVLAAGQSVSVAGPFDLAKVEADEIEQTPALLPGETWNVSVPIDGVAPLVSLVASVRAVPLYTDPAGSTGPLAPVDADRERMGDSVGARAHAVRTDRARGDRAEATVGAVSTHACGHDRAACDALPRK